MARHRAPKPRALRRAGAVAAALALVGVGSPAPAGADSNNSSSAKLRQAVTVDGVLDHMRAFQQVADLAGGNRFAGTAGHDASVDYVVDRLRAAGYAPTLHTFTYDAFYERRPSQLHQLSPTAQTYVNGNDFRIMSYSGSGDVSAPLDALPGDSRGCNAADFAGFPAGSIALIERGACTFRQKVNNATAAGATAALIYNSTSGVLNGTLGATGLSAIPALGLTRSLGLSLLAQPSVTMRVVTDTASEPLQTANVLAELPGKDGGANVVMAGAHLDSVATGPGINDNGSGSAAVLEVAEQLAKTKPRNTVRFAWWSAEESGLIGATRYVAGLSAAEREKIALYLNFDMIGSPNPVRFVYDGDNSSGTGAAGPAGSEVIEAVFLDYFAAQGLAVEPTPFNGRSDYGPFIASGVDIPAGGLFTGAEGIKTTAQAAQYGGTAGMAYDPCYHAACDTIANVDRTVLDQMSDAIAHAVITFAQSTEAVNGVRGKGGSTTPTGGSNTGSGGGGGLHDDHEEEAA